ncbi:hypothetical protein [Nocardia otitidiscaviarum]|uniref:hypothetical protein n=1 Tax=Nocardia otitidiscaviarum TaxID=1823 RepID=UPI001893721E|nr:hypothetical protein [Nocardia otitidiscaviarum]MBF6241331.1 hypothetical protein [Nocardia otitidiscaviarum]
MIYESSRSITSSRTQEWARRSADAVEPAWVLSWWPERRFTREQARAGMELTELLSEPEDQRDAGAGRRGAEIARELGITVAEAVSVLYRRRLERGEA